MVYITARDVKQARRIAASLVTGRLAACANIFGGMRSLYFWEGRLRDDREAVLIVKTRAALLEKLIKRVATLHSYSVPCVVAWPITGGNRDFISWVLKETAAGKPPVSRRTVEKITPRPSNPRYNRGSPTGQWPARGRP
jgi:periplasmic divalent cation tolerance protein